MNTSTTIGQIGNISQISGMFAIGGDVVAGNKTVIQNIIQQVAKKIASQPYKFLSSYDIADRDIFFGRNALTERLAGEVPRHKVLLINGASGSGKSSLINAGLIPRLADNGYTYLSFRDYHDPLRQLQDCLVKTNILPTANLQSDSLLQTIQTFQQQQLQIVFIFDQFERFFVNVPSLARSQFIEMIKVCMDNLQPTEMNVVFSMREEFFGQFQREFEKTIRAFLNECRRENIEPLTKAEAREAIIKPLSLIEAKIGYDTAFVDNVLLAGLEAEAREQKGINPPHLQIVCNQLYQTAHQAYLKHHDLVVIDSKLYEQLGGAQTILHTYLDDCVKTVAGNSITHIQILRSLLKQMIETVGTRKFVTIKQLTATVPEIPSEEVETLLNSLQDARVIEVRSQEQSYSLSHEVMVGKVASWFDEREMERRKAEETLEHGLIEWKNSGALLNEKQVEKVRTLLTDLNKDAQQLLLESEKSNRTKRQFMRSLQALLVVFVLLSIAIGIFSYFKAVEAYEQLQAAQKTQSLFLADLSQQQTKAEYATEGMLLALEALPKNINAPDRPYVLQAETSLYQSLFGLREQQVLHHENSVNYAEFSPDRQQVVTASDDSTARLWNAESGELLVTLQGHTGEVTHAAFNANGQRVLTVSDETTRVWSTESGELLVTLQGHTGEVTHAAFSPNGQRVVTASGDNTARLWNATTGESLFTLQGHKDSVIHAAFSADGQRVVTASSDKTARLWNATNGTLLVTLQGHTYTVRHAAFSANGQQVVTASDDSTARLWNATTGESLFTLQGHTGSVTHAAFSANGQWVVTASEDKTARVWNATTGESLFTLQGHTEPVNHAAFSPDGQRVVTASIDNTARLWNATSGALLVTLQGHEGSVNHAAFSADGQRVLTTSYYPDNTARVWNAASGALLVTLQGHTDRVIHAAFSPDGQRVVTASGDNTARLWNATTGESLFTLQGHKDSVIHAAFSPDGQRVVTASIDNTARLWNATSGVLLVTLQGHTDRVIHAAFSPDGQRVVTASADSTARLWNADNGALLVALQGHEGSVYHAAFSANGQRVVTASNDYTARAWNAESGALLVTLQGYEGSVYYATFSTDGQWAVTASDDYIVRLWNTESGTLLATLQGDIEPVEHAAFSADGQRVVMASLDNTVRLWNATSGALLITLQGHTDSVIHAEFSADGQRVVTASLDNTARLWNADNGALLVTLQGHTSTVNHAAFSADGQRVVTASDDNTARVWRVPTTQALIDEANRLKPRDLTIAQREQFFLSVSKEMRQAQEKITQGTKFAEAGDFTAAQNAFVQAIQLDNALRFNPTVKAQVLTANALLPKGEELAKEEKTEEAIAVFAKVLALNSHFTFDPQQKANQLVAPVLVSKGESLAQEGKIDEAIANFKRAQELDANIEISADSWNTLCRQGCLAGQAAKVLEFCETAVKLTKEQDANIRDSRGLARALTNDFKGAIADFQFFVQHTDSEEMKTQRQSWIKALKKGKNPITEEVLESLKQ